MNDLDFTKLCDELNPAIVSITSMFYDKVQAVNTYSSSSGFLVEKDDKIYVITSAHSVLRSTVNDPADDLSVGIYRINNVIGNNRAYKLKIVGVDGLADMAVCKIVSQKGQERPEIGKHKTITIGNNLTTLPGATMFNIANPLAKDLWSISKGTLRDNKYLDPTGKYLSGCITTSVPVYPSCSGSPFLNLDGECLGLVSFGFIDGKQNTQAGFAGGVGAFTMKIILDNIISKKHVDIIETNNGKTYLSNRKAWFGHTDYISINQNIYYAFKDNYANLNLNGISMTRIPKNSPLANPIKGEPLREKDIILSLTNKYGEKINIGSTRDRYSPGIALWTFDPKECAISTLEIIRNPKKNSNIDIIEVDFSLEIKSDEEAPPTTGDTKLADYMSKDCSIL